MTHVIMDYTGGPEGDALIVAHCKCGVVSAPRPTCDEAAADLELHVPTPAYTSDVRAVSFFQAHCSCGWESEPEETPEGADALADAHDDSHATHPVARRFRQTASRARWRTVR